MVDATLNTPTRRLVFFDNLRYLMVLLVLIFHSAASYGTMVAFWPFHEANSTEFLDILMILFETFMMPILFFIAGYFALSSIQKASGWRFLKGKIVRLGIPWFALTVFVLPVLDYIHYYSQASTSGAVIHSLATHWLLSMKTIGSLYVGAMDMSHYFTMTEQFYQRYLWFLSLLLLFSVVLLLLYKARNKWAGSPSRKVEEIKASNKSIYGTLLFVGILTVILYIPMYIFLSPDLGWFSLGNIIQFQPTKLVFYVSYFGLGVYAFSRKWFTNGTDFGHPWVWFIIWFLLAAGNLLVGRSIIRLGEHSLGLQLAFGIIYPLWTLSALGLFTAFAARRWNRPRLFDQALASHSYNMYLVHYVFPMTLPLLLSFWSTGPILVKFGIVAIATILLSYAISRYVVSAYPRLTILGIIVVFVSLLLIL